MQFKISGIVLFFAVALYPNSPVFCCYVLGVDSTCSAFSMDWFEERHSLLNLLKLLSIANCCKRATGKRAQNEFEQKTRSQNEEYLTPEFAPEFVRKSGATNFDDSGGSQLGEELPSKNRAKFAVHDFVVHWAVQKDPQIFSQNSSQFITSVL